MEHFVNIFCHINRLLQLHPIKRVFENITHARIHPNSALGGAQGEAGTGKSVEDLPQVHEVLLSRP